MDVWFTNNGDHLWYAVAPHDCEPERAPMPVRGGVANVLRLIRKRGIKIDQVGICPPDMLGLE